MNPITIDNVTANAEIASCDENTILEKIPESEYRPNGFPAIGIKVKHSQVWLYKSGKMASNGAKSIKHAIDSIIHVIHEIESIGVPIQIKSSPKISMIVANSILDGKPDYSKLENVVEKSNPKFSQKTLYFEEHKAHVRITKNKKIGISAPSLEAIITIMKKLDECIMTTK